MKILAWVLLLSILYAGSSNADVYIGLGKDIKHRKDIDKALVLEVDYIRGIVWQNNYSIFAIPTFGNTWKGGLGAGFVRHTEKSLGTNLNFLIELGYCWETTCLTLEHISHGAFLGIADDKPNAGINILTLKFKY